MAEKITWREPPPTTRQGSTKAVWRERLENLRKRPGKWAVWRMASPGTASSYAHQIKHGNFTAVTRSGRWEATTRQVGDEKSVDLYVRYVGDE